uniref:Uncharacterized protein n=1 Tax=Rhizophora mucronata TaxID=61149 RepID=A0A2P2JN26_RHIMU
MMLIDFGPWKSQMYFLNLIYISFFRKLSLKKVPRVNQFPLSN